VNDARLNVVELRRYTLRPGQRDVLIDIFDHEFVETQEATGMHLVGQFRDVDHPDMFVWIRSFVDMTSRHDAVSTFYSGPAWKAHGRQAAATMLDSGNVLLLQPDVVGPALTAERAPAADTTNVYLVVILHADDEHADATRAEANDVLSAHLATQGLVTHAVLRTLRAANTYAGLPVREEVNATVLLASATSSTGIDAALATLPAPNYATYLEVIRLTPTTRSRLQ